MDIEAQRTAMVKRQLKARGIRDRRVLDAMSAVPRHSFFPESMLDKSYEDQAYGIGYEQTISQPYMVALMTELLELSLGDRVLEIGTGSGYQASILSRLSRQVYSVERVPELAKTAEAHLQKLGVTNVTIRVGDGTLGWPEHAPYDAIIVTAGAPRIPETLLNQLGMNGRLVCPVGNEKVQDLLKITRNESGCHQTEHTACRFVPLLGEEGWKS